MQPRSSSKNTRYTVHSTKKRAPAEVPIFTAEETVNAIKRCTNNKAFGPDRMTIPPRSKIPVTRSRRNLQERDGKNAGSCRNTPKVIGTRKQYSGWKISGFFPVISDQFLAGKHRKVIGMHRKKFGNFPTGILLPCSGDFRCIPAGTVPYSLTWASQTCRSTSTGIPDSNLH